MRVRLLLLFLLLILLPGDTTLFGGRPRLGTDTRIRAIAVPLDARDPARRRLGPLAYLAGWEIRGRDPAFGSFSAMTIEDGVLVMLSDAGGIQRLAVDGAGAIRGISFADLPGGPGPGREKRERDSESMTRDPATGQIWVGFENANAIGRYAPGFARMEALARPRAMRRWPYNGGPEAMVRLRSGRFLVFSETAGARAGQSEALAFDGDPTAPGAVPLRFYYRPAADYCVTDAVELPDGRVLLLERGVGLPDLLSAKLSIVDPRAIRADETLPGREIATLARPITVDNMEAMALAREGGRTILWIASDDNFSSPFQRTLLMKFALDEKALGER